VSEAWSLRLEPAPEPSLRERILAPLASYNEAQGGSAGSALFAVTVRDAADEVVGGLWGRIGYGYMFVELLTAGPARRQGLGRQMMAMAETEARARGLLGIWLDTWTFQAPDFYPKLGFVECGRITDYPPGHDRIFFVKRF
jgi:GNAT superfamily N-acetyltransferase